MNYEETRDALAAAARERDAAQQELVLARDELARRGRGRADALRTTVDVAEPPTESLDAARERLSAALAAEARLVRDFTVFSDPREHARQLTGSLPIMLFPLRIETRFQKNELW